MYRIQLTRLHTVTISVAILILILSIGSNVEAEKYFKCSCQAEKCGNGYTPGIHGKTFNGISEDRVKDLFNPDLTGRDKTGWACSESSSEEAHQICLSKIPKSKTYQCVCMANLCGNGARVGKKFETYNDIPTNELDARFRPGLSGAQSTGWSCKQLDSTYTCACNSSICGGARSGEYGDIVTHVPVNDIETVFGICRNGTQATGWICKRGERIADATGSYSKHNPAAVPERSVYIYAPKINNIGAGSGITINGSKSRIKQVFEKIETVSEKNQSKKR